MAAMNTLAGIGAGQWPVPMVVAPEGEFKLAQVDARCAAHFRCGHHFCNERTGVEWVRFCSKTLASRAEELRVGPLELLRRVRGA